MAPPASRVAVDLISNLHDDLLLRILSFLPASNEVARTTVLSRRWRHLWPNAFTLCFSVGSDTKAYKYTQADRDLARRVIAAATATLSQRNGGPDVEVLDLSFVYSSTGDYSSHFHSVDITSDHVAVWLLFAARHVTRWFELTVPTVPKKERRPPPPELADEDDDADETDEEEEDVDVSSEEIDDADDIDEEQDDVEHADEDMHEVVEDEGWKWKPLPEYKYDDEHEEERVLSAEFPSSARAEEMILTLGGAILKVPAATAAGAFQSLTDLQLSHAQLHDGSDLHLSHVLSLPCSPCLKRLQLNHIEGVTELHLDAAATLEELQLLCLSQLQSLQINAPRLSVLGIKGCHGITSARILAPRVETLVCHRICPAERLWFDGAASVRRIQGLRLSSHRLRPHRSDDDDSAVWLLCHCTAADQLDLDVTYPLYWPHQIVDKEYEENLVHVPQLPNVVNLAVKARIWPLGHAAGATLAKLIAKCAEIESLYIDIFGLTEDCSEPECICNHPKGWEEQNISLQQLRSIEICNFLPYEGQMRILRFLLVNTPALERMTVTLQMIPVIGRRVVDFHIPSYGGRWVPCKWYCDRELEVTWATRYEWTRLNTEVVEEQRECIDLGGQCVF